MKLRDSRCDKASYDAVFKELEDVTENCLDPVNIAEQSGYDPCYECVEIGSAGQCVLETVLVAYARGDTREDLCALFERGIGILWQSEDCFKQHPRYSPHDINLVEYRFLITYMSKLHLGATLQFNRCSRNNMI